MSKLTITEQIKNMGLPATLPDNKKAWFTYMAHVVVGGGPFRTKMLLIGALVFAALEWNDAKEEDA